MNNKFLLEMENIRKSFGHIEALKGVDVNIMKGEVLGLVGDNAAGKSTLIKILSGAIRADSGRILLNGREKKITCPADSRNLGIETVYQTFALVDNLPIYSNIFLGRLLVKKILGFLPLLDKNSMIKKAWETVGLMGISFDSVKRRVSDLSGGQRQAVAIARSIFFNLNLLILDEPTAGLAVKEINKIEEIVLNLKSKNISIILISHRLESVFRTADRIIVLRSGTKVMDKENKKLTNKEVVEKMFGLE